MTPRLSASATPTPGSPRPPEPSSGKSRKASLPIHRRRRSDPGTPVSPSTVLPDPGLPAPDPHWAIQARLYRQGLGLLLDDQGPDGSVPLPPEVVRGWDGHLNVRGTAQLSFFLAESPVRLRAMGLLDAQAHAWATLWRLVHPVRVPGAHEGHEAWSVQARLLEERLCPLDPGPMAAWLQQVHETLVRPTADPRSAEAVGLLLQALAGQIRL